LQPADQTVQLTEIDGTGQAIMSALGMRMPEKVKK
jgi:hypothetical protein